MSLIRIASDVGLAGSLSLCVSACRGDSMRGSAGDVTSDATGGSDSTGSGTDTGEVLNCGEPETPPAAPPGPFLDCEIDEECIGTLTLFDGANAMVDPKMHCPSTNEAFEMATGIEVLPGFTLTLHHPLMEGSNSMPLGHFPLIIFQHGEKQSAQFYRDYWEAIVPLGVLVADGDFVAGTDLHAGGTQSHQTRPYTMRCVAEYLASTQAASLNFDLVLAGHSRGGFAALRAAKFMLENPGQPADFSLNGVWMLGPDATSSAITNDDWIHPNLSTNILVLQGSIENDAVGGALTHYERLGIEELGPDPGGEKTLVWVYDLTHNSWGGDGPLLAAPPQDHYGVLSSPEMVAKAQTIALGYVLPFVRRHLTGQSAAGDLDILQGTEPPPNVDNPAWWSYLDAWQTPQWDGRPVILTSRVDGCDADRLVIDDFARDGQNATLAPTSSEGWPVSMAPPGFATRLEVLESPVHHHHDFTSVMDVAWDSPGRIEWDCPTDEKCMPHGTDLWEVGCFPLAEMPLEIGGPCEDEDQFDGLDPCVAGSMCVLQEGGQVCSPFCNFIDGDYTCPSEDQSCTVGSAQGNRWCLDNCDPLASNCSDGTCKYVGNGFLCTVTGTKQYGEPCAFDHECGSGMGCAAQSEVEGCEGGCCTPYCTMGGDPCPEVANGQECLLIYDAPEAFADVGACTWPV